MSYSEPCIFLRRKCDGISIYEFRCVKAVTDVGLVLQVSVLQKW